MIKTFITLHVVSGAALIVAAAVAVGACALSAAADTVTINPSKDNTLIQPEMPTDPLFSNALGSLYCGRVGSLGGNTLRRFVLAFDIGAAVPAGSTITNASLALRIESTAGGNQTNSLRKALGDWGEGTSFGLGAGSPATTNDVTWYHRFYNTQTWTNPGGDYSATVSASRVVGSSTTMDYVWTDPQMATDLQSWLDTPASNFGWLMLGNEGTPGIAKGFWSREAPDVPFRPRLTITYTPPKIECPADIDNNGAVDVDDLIAVILSWGCADPPGPCPADIDDNGIVDVDDLIAVILAWGPCA